MRFKPDPRDTDNRDRRIALKHINAERKELDLQGQVVDAFYGKFLGNENNLMAQLGVFLGNFRTPVKITPDGERIESPEIGVKFSSDYVKELRIALSCQDDAEKAAATENSKSCFSAWKKRLSYFIYQ